MDVLKITLDEDGKVLDFSPDFKVYRGSYKNILINVEVPKCLLIEEATDVDTGQNITGNNIRVGAIIRTATGRNIKTKGFGLSWVKDFTKKEVEYSLYQRRMPQVFTKWETVSQLEQATSGLLEMIFNVVNWHLDDNGAKIEQVVTAPIVPVDVYQTDYLDDEEEIDASELEILQGEVDNHEKQLIEMNKELFGDDSDTLGTYLLTRLIAGNKIIIEKDETNTPNNQIKISFEPITAKEVELEHIDEILSKDVQGAIRELNSRTNNKNIDSVTGIDQDMVDNTDPYNPIILHDPKKADVTYVDSETKKLHDMMPNKADLVDGKVSASQLPSYVDDTLEVESLSSLPEVGESGKIYVTLDTNLTYRWTGTTYVEISKSLAIGETDNTAYRGDKGKTAYDHSQSQGNPHKTKLSEIDGDSTHRTVTDEQIAKWNDNSVILYSETGKNTDGAMTQETTSKELAKKVDIAQGIGNANKTMVTDAEGNVTPSDVVYVGGITIQKGTTEDGETCIEFMFPGESE